jgi:hypothetical protein
MANTIRIKRRVSGLAGAPSGLKNAELAHNEVDNTLYIGKGDDGAGNATSVAAIGGAGAFVDLSTAQTVAGVKTFLSSPQAPTPSANDNSTRLATTAYVDSAVSGAGQVASVNGQTGIVVLDTDDVAEGSTNLYHTQARARAAAVSDAIVDGVTDVAPSQNAVFDALALKLNASEKGAANGVATLDSGGKVPVAQLPNSVMEYLGTWDASTNTPTLANGTGNAGDVYVVGASGTVDFGAGNITFAAGDWVIYSGTQWQKSINSNAVASVNGFTGVVVLDTGDIAEDGNLYFTEARVRGSVLAGFTAAGDLAIAATDTVLQGFEKLQGQVAARLVAANNLSDLANAATARNNLGLGTMAVQNASNVSITGGTIEGVTLDGGVF